MILRLLILICFFFHTSFPLWKGKIPEPKEAVIVYAEKQTNVSFSMLSFANLTKEKELDVYENEMSKILGQLLKNKQFLEKDIRDRPKVTFQNRDKYDKIIFPFSITNTNSIAYQETQIDTNTNLALSTNLNLTNSSNELISADTSLTNLEVANDLLVTDNAISNTDSASATNEVANLTNATTNIVDSQIATNETNTNNIDEGKFASTYSNYTYYLTNYTFYATNENQTNEKNTLAYIQTNTLGEEYTFFIKKSNVIYVDGHTLTHEQTTNYLTNGIYSLSTNEHNIRYLIKVPYSKAIKIDWQKDISEIDYKYLEKVVDKIQGDIAIGGSFERLSKQKNNDDSDGLDIDILKNIENNLELKNFVDDFEKDILVKIFVLEKNTNTIRYLLSYPVSIYRLNTDMNNLSQIILAKLDKKKLYANHTYTSDPPGGFLYIDGQFVGETPVTLPYQILGYHNYKIHAINHYLNDVKSDLTIITNTDTKEKFSFSNANNPNNYKDNSILDISPDVVRANATGKGGVLITSSNDVTNQQGKGVIMYTDKSNTKTHFTLNSYKADSEFEIVIKDGRETDLYLGPIILKNKITNYQGKMPVGNYYLIARQHKGTNNFIRKFQFDIQQEKKLTLEFNMNMPQINFFDEYVLDHERNVKVFGALGLLTGSIGVYYLVRVNNFRDQLSQGRLNPNLGSSYVNHLTDEIVRHETISSSLIATSILNFIFSGVSFLYFTKEEAIQIESNLYHSEDVKFTYTRNVKF